VKFAAAGGRVRVEIAEVGADVLISVEDSGPGIPEGSEASIFERFWRADPSRSQSAGGQGTGLGLAIAKVIAERHGGSIAASNASTLGGARIEVRLPIRPSGRRDEGFFTSPSPILHAS
jgi:signal transduction histidine kinase